MIQGLFETHINVANLERSAAFYEQVLGLKLITADEKRRSRFYWVGPDRQYMLGIREHYPSPLVQRQHFAFRTTLDDLRRAVPWLRERGIEPTNFYDTGVDPLYVFPAFPAVSVYFTDPDGHSVELLALLPDEPRPDLAIMPWSEWEAMHGR